MYRFIKLFIRRFKIYLLEIFHLAPQRRKIKEKNSMYMLLHLFNALVDRSSQYDIYQCFVFILIVFNIDVFSCLVMCHVKVPLLTVVLSNVKDH